MMRQLEEDDAHRHLKLAREHQRLRGEELREKQRQNRLQRKKLQQKFDETSLPELTMPRSHSESPRRSFLDSSSSMDRRQRLSRLLEVACLQAPLKKQEVETDEQQVSLLCMRTGGSRNSALSIINHLGVGHFCNPESDALAAEVQELERRRQAAAELLDEVENEVVSLNVHLHEKSASTLQRLRIKGPKEDFSRSYDYSGSLSLNTSNNSSIFQPCGFDDDGFCEGSTTRELVSSSRVDEMGFPRVVLRSELKEHLEEAQAELADLRLQLRQVQEASSLERHRRPALTALGSSFNSSLLCLQVALAAWRNSAHARRVIARTGMTLAGRSNLAMMEACFNSWKVATLQLWADAVENRLARADNAAGSLALRLMLGEDRGLLQTAWLEWFRQFKESQDSRWRDKIEELRSKVDDSTQRLKQDSEDKKKGGSTKAKRCCVVM
eukprot:TRINITY_DN18087_c2_g1_i1.p1 TRINITY_DN18087_c2_g1~~TRINITY_DN18087_c2_g1_i1.p1  ORF type:complete len:440 (-),score=70.93 TRINITY_DN18087_c2_g1_i1:81-1400(-)